MQDGAASVIVELLETIEAIPASDWDLCACAEGRPRDPFTTHRFLLALEESGSVGPGTGWTPRPLVARFQDEKIGRASCRERG